MGLASITLYVDLLNASSLHLNTVESRQIKHAISRTKLLITSPVKRELIPCFRLNRFDLCLFEWQLAAFDLLISVLDLCSAARRVTALGVIAIEMPSTALL